MTEYEAASIGIQQSQLAIQQSQLAIQQSQLWAAIAAPVVAALVGAAQTLAVVFGVRAMTRSTRDRTAADSRRAEAAERAADRRAEAAEKEAARRADMEAARHAETMRALEVLIERTGSRA